MAEMNIKQIIDRLNAEFTGDTRKLVFWYDDNGEFVEDMQNVELENAKVYFLQADNQFATKLSIVSDIFEINVSTNLDNISNR